MKIQPQKVMAKRKKATGASQPVLERVLGLSSRGGNCISANPITGDVAYTAAGVIVIYNPTVNKQIARLINTNCRTFACVSFSADGKLLAAGEGACKGPKVMIWEYNPPNILLSKTLEGHRFGIERVHFSPSGELLVTVGVEHDQGLFLWNWRQGVRLTANKLGKKVNSLAFSPDGSFFVTCGQKTILYWLFDEQGRPVVTPASEQAQTKCMACKGTVLMEMKDKTFTSIAAGASGVYAITEDGKFCIFSREREMEKWMDLQVQGGAAIQVRDRHIYCGCTDGLIRCFDTVTLEHLVTLPRPPPLGAANITTDRSKQPQPAKILFADIVALDVLGSSSLLALYSDRTVFIWDLKKLDGIVASRALLNHSGAVNDLKVLPYSTPEMTMFATGSDDKTVRLWYILHGRTEGPPVRNVFSKDLSQIIYVSKTFDHLRAKKTEDTSEGAIKCIAVSGDGRFLASGDLAGVVRVHELPTCREVKSWVAHNNEVISVDFSGKAPTEGQATPASDRFLASCSRDRIIHLTRGNTFEYVGSCEDHTSSVTDIKFARIGDTERLVSCSMDKITLFRTITVDRGELKADVYSKAVNKQRKCHCLEVHPVHKELITAEDKSLYVWDLENGKAIDNREMTDPDITARPDSYSRVALDSSGMLAAAAGNDKYITLFDYYSGRMVAKVSVGEKVNALAFTPGGEKLLSATNDGCVFIWALPKELTGAIRARLSNMRVSKPDPLAVLEDIVAPFRPAPKEEAKEEPQEQPQPVKRLHDSQLPAWAKRSIMPTEQKPEPPSVKEERPIPGKWGKNATIEFGFEDVEGTIEPSAEAPPLVLQKVDIRSVEEVESEDEKNEDQEGKPIIEVSPAPSTHQNFNVTRSVIGLPKREEEQIAEAAYEPSADEEEFEEIDPKPRPRSPPPDPLRQSLTSTFLLRKGQEPPKQAKVEEVQPMFFNLEPPPESDAHVPKVVDFKKKKAEGISDMRAQISEVVQGLDPILKKDKPKEKKRPWTRPESDFVEDSTADVDESLAKLNKSSRSKLPMGKLIADDQALEKNPFAEAAPPVRSDPEEIKATEPKPVPAKPVEPKPSLVSEESIRPIRTEPRVPTPAVEEKKNEVKFDSPAALTASMTIPESLGSISSSQFFASARSQPSRQLYAQSFRELKQSLQSVNTFFNQVDKNDVEYSTSLEESSKDIEEIHQLISSISSKLGLPSDRESQLLERFSEQLVSKVIEKLGRR